MAAKKFQPGLYRVTNTGRRNRVRDGVLYPGAKDARSKGATVEATITSRDQLHRIRACRFLEVEGPIRARAGKKAGQPEPAAADPAPDGGEQDGGEQDGGQ